MISISQAFFKRARKRDPRENVGLLGDEIMAGEIGKAILEFYSGKLEALLSNVVECD